MQNPFKRVFSALQPGSDSVIGVDAGSAYLKVVQLRRKAGRAVLETYGSLALGPYGGTDIGRATNLPVARLAEALRDIMREAHVTTNHAAVAIPLSSSLVTIIDMLVLDEKQLPITVPIEARKYVPVPISEVNLDWWIIPQEPSAADQGPLESEEEKTEQSAIVPPSKVSKKQQILIAAIHNEAMRRFEDIAREAALEVGFFEIEIFSAMRAALSSDLEPHALLDLGASGSKLYIIDRGLVRISHFINQGAQDLTMALSRALNIPVLDAEKLKRAAGLSAGISGIDGGGAISTILNVIFAEANRAISNFELHSSRKVCSVTLIGGGVNLPGFFDIASSSFSAKVERVDPFAQVEAPAFLDDTLKAVGPEFAVALGVAVRRLQEAG